MRELKGAGWVSLLVSVCLIALFGWLHHTVSDSDDSDRTIRVGFVYEGDESTPYTYNFIRSQRELEARYGSQVIVHAVSNASVEDPYPILRQMAEDGCDILFTTSSSFGEAAKRLAGEYPELEVCHATGSNANEDPVYPNYHNFMGEIYEGRYLTGLVAGMKLREMLDQGILTPEEAKIGYVAAFPYPEVISGYTAFFLGVRAAAPEAVMSVIYTHTWSSYTLEKAAAERLIGEGCVILSQHSDTIGPAVACENAEAGRPVYHVGYNQSMLDVAPTTSLISCRINWTPYILGAVEAVLAHETIEKHVSGHVHGNDIGAGLERDWVQLVELNTLLAPEGVEDALAEAAGELENGRLIVFEGDYLGVDPIDPTDTMDLSLGYRENQHSSAPLFHYVLRDVITVLD